MAHIGRASRHGGGTCEGQKVYQPCCAFPETMRMIPEVPRKARPPGGELAAERKAFKGAGDSVTLFPGPFWLMQLYKGIFLKLSNQKMTPLFLLL